MAYFTRIRLIIGLALFGLGAVLIGAEPAAAQSQSEQVQIFSGFETAASQRTRTIVRRRQRGDQLVIDRRRIQLGGNSELSGGTLGRASTGRSRETVQNGVRVINGRGSQRNITRIVATR